MAWANTRKHVPDRTRKDTLERDGYRCTATLRDGQRCPQVVNLEAHHITPWHPEETPTPDNLTTLCRWHHQQITQQQARAARMANPLVGERRPPETHPGLR